MRGKKISDLIPSDELRRKRARCAATDATDATAATAAAVVLLVLLLMLLMSLMLFTIAAAVNGAITTAVIVAAVLRPLCVREAAAQHHVDARESRVVLPARLLCNLLFVLNQQADRWQRVVTLLSRRLGLVPIPSLVIQCPSRVPFRPKPDGVALASPGVAMQNLC